MFHLVFNEVFQRLGKQLKFDGLLLDNNNSAFPKMGTLELSPDLDNGELYHALLTANSLGCGTGGFALGIDLAAN